MRSSSRVGILAVVVLALLPRPVEARTASYSPKHIPPLELQDALGARGSEGQSTIIWRTDGSERSVEVRRNGPSNLLLFSGDDGAVAAILELAAAYDQPPRQISLEAHIVEVDTDRARDLGIDWSQLAASADGLQQASRRHSVSEVTGTYGSNRNEQQLGDGIVTETTRLSLNNALKILEAKGAATTRDMPRVVTLNNRTAVIFDGHRVTYVNRANGYAQLFETETMDAGLKLEVTPSLVESGQLRLQLTAELTELAFTGDPKYGGAYAAIGGSPVKRGQILENTIVARDGEPIVLAGFTRTVEQRSHSRFPILGSVLPFLFSRETSRQSRHESLLMLTPRIVDLATGPNEAQKKLLEGR